MKKLFLLVCIPLLIGMTAAVGRAQTSPPAATKRILILLDGSGSMVDPWNGTNKWEVAKKLVTKTIDSIQRSEPGVEVGLRVFGFQQPRAVHDCKDSKLVVPIGKNTGSAVKSALASITPQGYTPIAYSLFLAAGDFPTAEAANSIILITDGIENCDGDPCASTQVLRDKRITLKPFIIGLGIEEKDKKQFECVGAYYDASNEKTFANAMSIVISQALNITTTQINLLDAFGLPLEKNIEITLYDHASGELRYNYVHTPDDKQQPDTLFLNPVGKYDITVHTTPPIFLNDVELTPGKHNIIGIDVPLGTLVLSEGGNTTLSEKQLVLRDNETGVIIYVQNFNTKMKYVAGTYDIDILTLPRLHYDNYEIKGGVESKIDIPVSGTLNITLTANTTYSIYTVKNDQLEKVYENTMSAGMDPVQLLPGEYIVVSRSNIKKVAASTKEQRVQIKSAKTTTLKL
ncbi:MAG TPA: VWA domain-containing protein [Chitinophagales bacterium]|nr:VWA domain-containing protein [Chitinophagales bacterium]